MVWRDAPTAIVVACCRALEANHRVAVHQDLEANLGKVCTSETYAIHRAAKRAAGPARTFAGPAACRSSSAVLAIIVELILPESNVQRSEAVPPQRHRPEPGLARRGAGTGTGTSISPLPRASSTACLITSTHD